MSKQYLGASLMWPRGARRYINGKGKGKAANGATGSKAAEFAWQVRHAGLVGIKYEVAVRPDLFDDPMNGKEVLKGVVEAAVSG